MERTNKTPILILLLSLSVVFFLITAASSVTLLLIQPSEAEQLNNCREVMMNKALGDEYVDYILDSVANARADSIVEHRMYLLMPDPE